MQPKHRTMIVSSAHLVSERAEELSEFEYGLIIASHAFQRWMIRCQRAAGGPDLSAMDILVLNSVNHRDRPKTLSDLSFVLNVEDTHVVNYSLRKIYSLGLIKRRKRGKEVIYEISASGKQAIARYREVREACLVEAFTTVPDIPKGEDLAHVARALRGLSGIYDQASRSATSL